MMKQLVFFLFFSSFLQAQKFVAVKEVVEDYPSFNSVEELANRINADFTLDLNKVKASYFWLAKNIRYDIAEYYNPVKRAYNFSYNSEADKNRKLQSMKNALVNRTFKTKKGVCEEYAQSFKKICDLLGIESEVIKGNVRISSHDIGKVSNTTNHAWNAVKINNDWLVLDATWGAGYEQNGRWRKDFNPYYFNIPKNKIFKTHLPNKSIWILRFGRISKEEFYNQPIYSSYFLKSKVELLSPKEGIIRLQNNKDVELSFKNLTGELFYGVTGSKFVKKARLLKEGNITKVFIPNPNKSGNLSLFIGRKKCLKYKLTF